MASRSRWRRAPSSSRPPGGLGSWSPTSATTPSSRTTPTAACAWSRSKKYRSCRPPAARCARSEEHTSELQSLAYLVCRLLLEKKKKKLHLDQSTPGVTTGAEYTEHDEFYSPQHL